MTSHEAAGARDVAQWMIDQVHARGRVNRAELAAQTAARFGERWVIRSGETLRFDERVLQAFRRQHAGSVRYQQNYWETVG